MKTIIIAILLALLANLYITSAKDYIVVMKDGTNQNEMETVMDIMCDMSPDECDTSELRTTTGLMNTITGPMSEMAVNMARQMSCVSYIEEDQMATTADAVIDLSPPTTYPIIDPDIPYIHDPRENKFAAVTENEYSTDRYNLDGLDENCGACTNGLYRPKATGRGVDVLILDTGIRFDHSDFGGRAAYGEYDAVDDLQRQSQRGVDCHGHGTHCAGIAVGRVSGVAKEANVYSVRVLDCNSFGSFSGIIRALDHVYRRHMEKLSLPIEEYKGSVVSMSLAGPVVQAANDAVCRLVNAGVVVVTASGNFRRDACNYSPGSAGCHINVAAHYYTERDTETCIRDVYWFASRSTSPGNNYGRCVHMIAPGQYVQSSSYLDVNRYVSMSGTSMACPHVAGAAALLLDENPRMSPERVRALLRADSCPDINERRMPIDLRGWTANARLRVMKRIDEPITTPPPPPPTTTTPEPVPTTPSPQTCIGTCPFDSLRNSEAESIVVDSYEVALDFIKFGMYFQLQNRLSYNRQILTKISVTTFNDVALYSMVLKVFPSSEISNFVYLYNSKNGIAYQDIDEEINTLNINTGRTCYPKTIIPVGDNKVYILADCKSECNNNEIRQANYTLIPGEISNPFTIDNILGTKTTFDVSFTPNKNQVYVHNTVKTSPTCDCYNYLNVQRADLVTFSESIGRGRKLVIQDMDALYYQGQLLFTVTLCMQDCYTGSDCANEVVNSPVIIDLNKNDLDTMIESVRRLDWEPIASVGYYLPTEAGDEFTEKYAVSFLRVR